MFLNSKTLDAGVTQLRGSKSVGVISFANIGPIVEKKLLNSFAMFVSPVTLLPFTFTSLICVHLDCLFKSSLITFQQSLLLLLFSNFDL